MQFSLGVTTYVAIVVGGALFAFHYWEQAPKPPQCRLEGLELWSTQELQAALSAIQQEQRTRAAVVTEPSTTPSESIAGESLLENPQISSFRYVHKHTYASGDPKASAYFMAKYFGGWCHHEPGHGVQHTHCNDSKQQPMTWNVYYNSTKEQPHGFSIHFVKNPRKLPQKPMNQSDLALWLERWRGNFSKTGRFDQFMDNHLGLVFDSLNPLVEQWKRDGVPFLCRTWCCGPGMPQWPDNCPKDRDEPHERNSFCEQGCYVEVPHGIIVEALCGLESYNASRTCLADADSHLKVFDLCTDN